MMDSCSAQAPPRQRVLYVDTAPTVGGSVVSLYELLKNLDRSRYEPVVVACAPHAYVANYRSLGVRVVVDTPPAQDHRPAWLKEARDSGPVRWWLRTALGPRLYHALGFAMLLARRTWPRARALSKLIRQERIGIVHTNIRVGHDREGILAARLAGVPCVAHVRDFEELNWFDRKLAGMVSSFVYISRAVQQHHVQAGAPAGRGRVVYNAVDTSVFSDSLDATVGRTALGLAPGVPAVGVVGRLEPWKGQHVFLRAMSLVVRTIPEARGVIIGDPVPHEPEYPELLAKLRSELGLVQSVSIHSFRTAVASAMSALDLVVLASTSPEPFGRVLIEAMALGKAVVATDAGAAREIVEHQVHGLLVPTEDALALAEAIVRLLAHREEAAVMGQNGRARVLERFTLKQNVDGIEAAYRDLLT